ncbi:MAG: glycosyltransferase [Prevotella sp.]|nr:glycosyltransferase [Prevotella sp.]
MPKLLQINVSANWGSHGRIAEQIGLLAMQRGWEVFMAYGRQDGGSALNTIHIGGKGSVAWHGVESLLLDNQGLASRIDTKMLVRQIKEIQPDIIHLHNIHGYYLNYKILFEFLKEYGKPVVWTLHDCWAFTGHCTHFEYDGCFKWKEQCHDCVNRKAYPKSLFFDRSRRNFELKKKLFSSLPNLTIVPVSEWLDRYVKQSFLGNANTVVIHNGIDVDVFSPQQHILRKGYNILGVASNWKMLKGLPDFIRLRELLPADYNITLVGLTQKEINALPDGITGICRTNNIGELVNVYCNADVLVNPTYEDNYPTINLEAQACGTPVVTYRTGGSAESITDKTGIVVECGNIEKIADAVRNICNGSTMITREECRRHAEQTHDWQNCFKKYIDLYNKLISQ